MGERKLRISGSASLRRGLGLRWKERLLGGPSWEESIWAYRLSEWRCWLFGHKFGPEEKYYEDIGYPVHVSTHRDCVRGCGNYEEVWHV